MPLSTDGPAEDEPDDAPTVEPSRSPALPSSIGPSTIGGVLYLVILAITTIGLVVAALGPWRTGVRWVAGALITAAVVRAVLPRREAGMLAVRSRWLDVALLVIAGAALWFLAGSVPDT